MYVQVHDIKLWVETAGQKLAGKSVILLLHGFPDSSSLWSSQIAALAAAGHYVIAPDMLGYGRSDKPADVQLYKLRNIVILLCGVLDALDVNDKVVLVGHDWGAATAWAMAMQAPEKVQKLMVLSVGHPGAGAAVAPRQRAHWWYMLYFLLPGAEEALQANDWALFRQVMGEGCGDQQVQEYKQQLSQPGALTAALAWYRANTHARQFGQMCPWPVAAPMKIPVIGVWSSKDTALRELQMTASSIYIAPECWRYVKLEGVGHWIPREAPQKLNALLLQFIAGDSRKHEPSKAGMPLKSCASAQTKSPPSFSRL